MRIRARTLFTLGLIALFALVAWEAYDMPIQARLFPLTIAAVALPLLLWQLLVEVSPKRSTLEATDAGTDFAATAEERQREGFARAAEFFVWLFAFTLALWGLGFRVAIPTFLLLFLLRNGERVLFAALFALGGWAATHFIFGEALILPLPRGELWRALGLL